jgi:phosphate:Na+ symporter
VLQSGTATGLVTSFTASGLAPALAVMLGANVGTTLITEILAFNIAKVAPVLVLIGGGVFRSSNDGRHWQGKR